MSKDGDWILREDSEATDHVLETLSRRGSRYSFGAPLAETLPRRPLLDRERRTLIRAYEERLARFRAAAEAWAALWPEVAREIADLGLPQAHRIVTSRALGVLPFAPSPEEVSLPGPGTSS